MNNIKQAFRDAYRAFLGDFRCFRCESFSTLPCGFHYNIGKTVSCTAPECPVCQKDPQKEKEVFLKYQLGLGKKLMKAALKEAASTSPGRRRLPISAKGGESKDLKGSRKRRGQRSS